MPLRKVPVTKKAEHDHFNVEIRECHDTSRRDDRRRSLSSHDARRNTYEASSDSKTMSMLTCFIAANGVSGGGKLNLDIRCHRIH